jgi:hypothetical protein
MAVVLAAAGVVISIVSMVADSVPKGLQGWGLSIGFLCLLGVFILALVWEDNEHKENTGRR